MTVTAPGVSQSAPRASSFTQTFGPSCGMTMASQAAASICFTSLRSSMFPDAAVGVPGMVETEAADDAPSVLELHPAAARSATPRPSERRRTRDEGRVDRRKCMTTQPVHPSRPCESPLGVTNPRLTRAITAIREQIKPAHVLDVPFAMRGVAAASGARWDADHGVFVWSG